MSFDAGNIKLAVALCYIIRGCIVHNGGNVFIPVINRASESITLVKNNHINYIDVNNRVEFLK